MKTVEQWLFERSEAADAAKKAGLVSAGFGRWKDRDGKVVARTKDGKLVKVGTDEARAEADEKAKPAVKVKDSDIDDSGDAIKDDGKSPKDKIDALHDKIGELEKSIKNLTDTTTKNASAAVDKVPDAARSQVNTLLKRLKIMSDVAAANGEKAPNYDLCKVSVPGTNLFCEENVGIPRERMPQLKGNAKKGSKAAKIADKDGSADAEKAFVESLKSEGVKMVPKKVEAAALKASQTQLVGAKVAGMLDALKKNPKHPGITAPIFVSKDGYVLDGHHRWAAIVGLSLHNDEPVKMDTVVVDMSIRDLIKKTNDFANEFGIEQKGA